MGQKADFKLIIFVNSDVAPVNEGTGTSDPCGPGQAYQTHNFFVGPQVYKAACFLWAINPSSSTSETYTPTTWRPWGSADLTIDTQAWNPHNLYFEVWDTNPNLLPTNPVTCTLPKFGFATSDATPFSPNLFEKATPNYPPDDPTLIAISLPPLNTSSTTGSLTLSVPGATSVAFGSCAMWSASIGFSSKLKGSVKVKVVAFMQINVGSTPLYFTSDPDMILDAI